MYCNKKERIHPHASQQTGTITFTYTIYIAINQNKHIQEGNKMVAKLRHPHASQQTRRNTFTYIPLVLQQIGTNISRKFHKMAAMLQHPHASKQSGTNTFAYATYIAANRNKILRKVDKMAATLHMQHKKQGQIHLHIPLALQKIRTNISRMVKKIAAMLLDPHHHSKQEQIHLHIRLALQQKGTNTFRKVTKWLSHSSILFPHLE